MLVARHSEVSADGLESEQAQWLLQITWQSSDRAEAMGARPAQFRPVALCSLAGLIALVALRRSAFAATAMLISLV